ncbi:helix-turn-helix domain-containing protein [Pseudomonas putida]|uniref:Helix-turn-helix domain-containing protein n=1 Tax=Pseudomonas putida TaxID=303 RepID=A0A7D5VWL4_PSEPU|nr:helix-turn-helix domain-containing protein [Pseudomonas putida]QLJ12706.1 helix-turn-helix domain-containing protein [Pseudomonas putida]
MKSANGIPKDPALRWEWIKFQLRAHDTSLSELARQLGVERNALHNVKRVPYPRMETAIAKAIGLKPEQIWPERWNSDGTPNRQRSGRNDPPSENR